MLCIKLVNYWDKYTLHYSALRPFGFVCRVKHARGGHEPGAPRLRRHLRKSRIYKIEYFFVMWVIIFIHPNTIDQFHLVMSPFSLEDILKHCSNSASFVTYVNCLNIKSYVYGAVHHLDSWVKRKPTWCHLFYHFIHCSFNAQHVSAVNTTIFRSLRLIGCYFMGCIWFGVCWRSVA